MVPVAEQLGHFFPNIRSKRKVVAFLPKINMVCAYQILQNARKSKPYFWEKCQNVTHVLHKMSEEWVFIGHWVIGHWSLVIWTLDIGHWTLDIGSMTQ